MANYQDSNLNQVVFNKVTKEQYDSQVSSGEIKENEFYLISGDTEIPAIGESTSGQFLSNNGSNLEWVESTSGSYNDTTDKPQINTVTLEGNKTSEDLGLQDAETALNYNNITNCITKIPQDIKLELNDGTLTLKAGSKVYVPNGVGVFDVVTVESDLSTTRSSNIQEIYFVSNNGTVFNQWNNVYSGTSAPSGQTYMVWYDIENNVIKATTDSGATWIDGFSLPVCLATSNNTQITSIDQVFNGVGFMGSSVFTIPGLEMLLPNGLNDDGTLNNIKYTMSKVQIRKDANRYIAMNPTGGIGSANDFIKYIDDSNAYKGFVWNKMYRLDLVKKIMFDEAIYMNEDLLFNVEIATIANKFHYTPEKLYNYNIRTTSAYNQPINEKKLTSINAYKKIINIIKLYFNENEDDFQLQYLKVLLWLKNSINKKSKDKFNKIINKEAEKQYSYTIKNIHLSLVQKIKLFIKYKFPLLIKILKRIKMCLKG